MKFFYILLFFSVNSFASQCVYSETSQKEWNEKYSSLIKTVITDEGDAFVVLIKFPGSIEDRTISYVKLNLFKDKSNLLLSSDLNIFELDVSPAAYYEIGKEFKSDAYITAVYGKDCGSINFTKKIE